MGIKYYQKIIYSMLIMLREYLTIERILEKKNS